MEPFDCTKSSPRRDSHSNSTDPGGGMGPDRPFPRPRRHPLCHHHHRRPRVTAPSHSRCRPWRHYHHPGGIYTLTQGTELLINKSLTLNGAGAGDTIIQAAASSADATFRVFNMTGSGNNVAISGVAVQNGNTAADGAGIRNRGTLTLTDSTISGNSAGSGAGGIYNGGALTLTNSTVSGNSADSRGGGISNEHGGTLTLNNSTISGNTADSSGGGIMNFDGTINVKNTIIAGNIASNAGPDCSATLTSQGHNLVQNTSGCTVTGDLTGNITSQDPFLGLLADNGGPTLTHALLPGSPAIDSGDDSVLGPPLNLATDQRGHGYTRRYGTHVDIGAFEVQPGPKCRGLSAAIVCTPGPDTITGTSGDDVIVALSGNDTVLGMEGNDTICLGDGDDSGDGGPGTDRIYGERGKDDIRGGTGKDVLYGGNGKDVLRGDKGADRLFGGRHADLLKGGRHADRLFGRAGSDKLVEAVAMTASSGTGATTCSREERETTPTTVAPTTTPPTAAAGQTPRPQAAKIS